MTSEQNITHVRGDDLQVPVTVTLDQSRTLDGDETWLWAMKLNENTGVLITKSLGSGITVDGSNQPIIELTPADFPAATFPNSIGDTTFKHELSMVKDTKTETVTKGSLTLITDIAI